ncbi:TetR/AcrR family transcriptional regulator [Actinacidiphila oryziradicis]|uniref:TetR/AcrR family transcriptional regulator n=1 Tax=Actinacidiphila oryziradicis TaxID=2571141 RepID=UPI0023F1A5B4|nr:TetR/AcrR family transcriptional regulator [Actinacidiphila oryziradicis]
MENAILTAALEELTEVGYAALTMERVATRARTSKAALYRRWPGRAELVVDACKLRSISDVDLPDTGALRTDVMALLRQISAKMASPLGSILRGLLAEMTRDPEFARLIRERVHTLGPATIHVILERAVERGEVEHRILDSRRATVATDLLRNQFLLFGAPVEDEIIRDIVDDVYLPLVLSPAPNRAGGADAGDSSPASAQSRTSGPPPTSA